MSKKRLQKLYFLKHDEASAARQVIVRKSSGKTCHSSLLTAGLYAERYSGRVRGGTSFFLSDTLVMVIMLLPLRACATFGIYLDIISDILVMIIMLLPLRACATFLTTYNCRKVHPTGHLRKTTNVSTHVKADSSHPPLAQSRISCALRETSFCSFLARYPSIHPAAEYAHEQLRHGLWSLTLVTRPWSRQSREPLNVWKERRSTGLHHFP